MHRAEENQIRLAQVLKAARTKARLSQEGLAELAGISRRPIYLLENGKGSIRVDTLLKILDALGLTLSVQPKDDGLD